MRVVFRVCMILLGVILLRPAFADTVGMASQLTGKPQFQRAKTTEWNPLHLLQKLEVGDKIKCAEGEGVTVVLFGNGARYQLASNQSGTVQKQDVSGAKPLGALAGPSAATVQTLAGARTGSFLSRAPIRFAPPIIISSKYAGWLADNERELRWDPVIKEDPDPAMRKPADSYSFTLLDSNGDVVFHKRVNEPRLALPADMPKPALSKPYVWHLNAYFNPKAGASALEETPKRVPQVLWGVLTWLAKDDSAALASQAGKLEQLIKQDPNDQTNRMIQIELYRKYGVIQMALYKLFDLKDILPLGSADREKVDEAILDVYQSLGDYAQLFSGTAKRSGE